MESIFSKIISGKIPSYKVAEDNNCFAFLDINPNTIGHVLCVPKRAIDKLFDMPENQYKQLMLFSRKVALAMRKAIPCNRISMSVIGLDVPHAHIHLIPLHDMDDIRFQKKVKISSFEMQKTADLINSFFED